MAGQTDTSQSGATPEELKRVVGDIERMVNEIRQSQLNIRTHVRRGVLLILLILVAFAAGTYYKIRDNFSQEKIQAATAMRVKLLTPQLEAPMAATLREVVPYYVDMGRTRLQKLSPKLDARVQEEANKLAVDLEPKMNAQLQAFFGRLGVNVAAELTAKFPALAGDGVPRASARIKTIMEAEGAALSQSAGELYKTESGRIASSLAKFPVPDVSKSDLETLNRQLLHELLMYADYEMTKAPQATATVNPVPSN